MASARGVRAGRAFVEIGVRDLTARGLKNIGATLKRVGAQMARIGAAGVAAIGASISAVSVLSVKAASDMEEVMSKFNVVFGESAKAVKEWSDATAAAMGRSQKQMAESLASFQDLLVPMGMAPDQAMEMSKALSRLTVDLGSFNNKADADVLRDLQSALVGSAETMNKYGVIVKMANVNQELLNQNIDPKTATDAQKAMARFNIILRGTTSAQGDAVRTSESWANQMKQLRANIDDTMVAIGQQLIPILKPMLAALVTLAKATRQWIEQNNQLGESFRDGFRMGEESMTSLGNKWAEVMGKVYDWTVGWIRDLQVGVLQIIRAVADLAVKFDRLMGGEREDNIWAVWLDDIKRKQADIIRDSAQARRNWQSFGEDVAEAAEEMGAALDDLEEFAIDPELGQAVKPSPTTPATMPKGGLTDLQAGAGFATALERGSISALERENQKTTIDLMTKANQIGERTAKGVERIARDGVPGLVGV